MTDKLDVHGKYAPRWLVEWEGKVHTPDDLARFVDAVGCCTMEPLPGYPGFPYQYAALGERDPATPDHWFWKDDLHIEKRIYYTRVLGGQTGYISYALLPAFMATNGAVADEMIFNGTLSTEAQEVYHVIEAQGPLPTKNLKAQLTADTKRSADRLLIELERIFLVTKSDITGRTRGTYSYVWDLVERFAPEVLTAADKLGHRQAEVLLREHLAPYGVPPDSRFYEKILGWTS